jgi:salicylate hydroxylase
MMPFLAQGASQAIEDGVVLAGCLREATSTTVAPALARYETLRRERASKVQLASRESRHHHHLPDGEEQRRRDVAMAGDDPLVHNGWIYGHDVEENLV